MKLKKNVGRTPGGGRMEDLLQIALVNAGEVSVAEFALHLELPKGFVDGPRNNVSFQETKSNERIDAFAFTEKFRPGKIRPGGRPEPFYFRISAEGLPPDDYEASASVHVEGFPPVKKTIKLV